MTDKQAIIRNFSYRLGLYYPGASIRLGHGSINPHLVAIQEDHRCQNLDAITKVTQYLKIEELFVTSINIVQHQKANNLLILRELIDILDPYVAVVTGDEATIALKGFSKRYFKMSRYHGKPFISPTLQREVTPVYCPSKYVNTQGDKKIKEQSKMDWAKIVESLEKKQLEEIMERWDLTDEQARNELSRTSS